MKPYAKDQSKNPPPKNRLDRLLRRFSRFAYVIAVLLMYVLASTALGLALAPALWIWAHLQIWAIHLPGPLPWIISGFALAICFFIFGLVLLVVVPLYNWILPTRVKPFKGGYYTLHALPWFLHNVPFVTLTPFGVWFLKAMGMKIGRHAFINTEFISDPQLISVGDDAALGGSVRIFAHYGGGGNLVIAPVSVGHRATLGLACCVMGDVVIGDDAIILPESVLLPGSRVGAGETWGGVPARKIEREEMERIKAEIRGMAETMG
jgi:acetyltransferase-like isoleucine patch superfamily enzyme